MAQKVYIGDIGTEIILDTGQDLSTATSLKIKYRKPNGTTGEWAASQVSGDSTKMKYVTQEGDLDVAGTWELQAYVEFASWQGHGEIATLVVYKHL